MRKFLSFMMAVLFAGSLMAADVEITLANSGWSGTRGEQTCTVSGVTVTCSDGIGNTQLRLYKNSITTISVASGSITKIVFTCTANGTAQYGPGCFAAQTGYTYEAAGPTGTWTGSAASVSFTASSNQVRATSIVVTVETGAPSTKKMFYCKMNKDWWTTSDAAIGVYAFGDGDVKNAAWPGVRMEEVTGETGMWKAEVDTALYKTLIFVRVNGSGTIADWGAQTYDLALPEGDNNLYIITSASAQWSGEGNKVEGYWAEYPSLKAQGSWDEWAAPIDFKVAADGKTASFSKFLAAGDYEFKVIKNGEWKTKANGGEPYGLHREWKGVAGVTDDAAENLKVTADVGGTYTFTWTYANDSIGIDFPMSCSEVYDLAKNDNAALGEVVVTYVSGTNVWVKDATGAMLLYLPYGTTVDWVAGDTLSNVAGVVDVYNGLHEVKPNATQVTAITVKAAAEGTVVAPESLAVIDKDADMNKYIILKGITVAADTSLVSNKSLPIILGENTYALYNKFNSVYSFKAGVAYDVVALVTYYNALQVYFVSAEPQAKFYITGNAALVEDAGSTAAAWAADAIKSTADSYTLSLKAGVDYLMKVTFDGTWAGGSKGFEAIANPPAGVTGVDDGLGGNTNISFRLATDGDVTVTVAIVSGDTILTIAGDFELPAKYYITGNAALVGIDKAWNAAAVRATADSYTFLDLPAGDYRMKVTLDGTWDDPDNNVKGISHLTTRAAGLQDINGNIGFTLADKGDVTVTFNATKFELEGDFVETPIVKTFMATTSGWSSDDESSAVYDAVNEKIIVNLVKYKEAQWQAQVHYQGPIAKAGKYYDISLKFLANKNVNGVTLKYQDVGQLLYEEASVNLVADETYVYTKNNLDGVDGGNGIFVFDFGFAAAGTVIEISDIQIVERDAFYTVAGVPSLCGSNWDETDTDNDMVLSEGLYTWTKNDVILRKGNVEFKVVKNHDWNNGANAWPAENYALAIAQDGKYDVVITFNESTQEILATATFKEAVALDHTAVLKGLADNENPWIGEDMEQAQDKLTASITKYFVPSKPEGDTLEFKMVIDDAWRSNGYLYHRGFVGAAGIVGDVTPTDENNGNMKVVVDVEGDYVFTWTFANDSLGIEFPYKAPDVYTVAGDAVLFTSNWDPADDANDMPFDDVNGVFYWGADDVVLLTGNIEFKVVKNHDWNEGNNAWPAENYVLNIPQDGKYDVLITFNAETKEIVATATFKEPVEVDPTAVLKGLADGENPWVGEDMILAQDKLSASITKHFVPSDADGDTLTFKMMINGGWRSNGYLYHRGFVGATDIVDNVDDNMLVVVDIEGDYTFTWTFADNALEITFPAKPEPVLANGYYLIGKTGWDEEALSADLKFAANPDADGEFMLTIALAVSDHIKVVFVEDDAIQTWYPDGLGNEYIVDADHAGAAKTIYFKPAYDENWAAFGGYIWIDANSPATGINNTDANAKVEKVLENGQVFIIKNGQIFNVTGQLVK